MNTLSVGVVGCGQIAIERHLPVWRKIKGARVVAVTDKDKNRARVVAMKFHVPKWYTDYREMIETEGLDIVDVCTPTKYHKEHAIYACQRGKHVITEKPMALTSKDCQEMIEAFQGTTLKFTVCHTMIYYPAVRKVRGLIDKGDVGDVQMLRIVTPYCEAQPWVLSQGGVLWEYGIHRVYLLLYLMDGHVEKVEARTYNSRNPQENMEIIIYTTRGVGIIHILKGVGNEEFSIYGRKKKITFPSLPFNTVLTDRCHYGDWKDVYRSSVSASMKALWGMTFRGLNYLLRGTAILPHYNLIRSFIDSINGKGEVPVSPEEGKRAVQILEEVQAQIYS